MYKFEFSEANEEPAVDNLKEHATIQDGKIEAIEKHFAEILKVLGLDLTEDSLKQTPHRVAKMFVLELFHGLESHHFPSITYQENKFGYEGILLESKISIKSMCEHHFVPILGHCHIAYIPKDRIIGLSKLNRVADYFARRPQLQERMTKQIKECLVNVLETEDVAVVVDAAHLCVRLRGIEHENSLTRTYELGGKFNATPWRTELFAQIPTLHDLKL